ncbi:zinc knuckle [Ancylostoma duodenale]|uniref:Zinc knuckle n=1 Tax=Ancylostoma duodenale TaxID=51022 RepID=A0A0C2D557_9BILA|nr:zinc knuckle [Ancylostoma duodenale]
MKKLVERVTLGQSNPVQNERLLDEFLDRLKPALKFYVKASNPPIYDEAVVKALIYESLLTEAVNNLTIFPAANSATAQVNVATTQDANQGYDRRNQPQRFRSRSQFPSGYAYQNRTYSRRSFERAPNSEVVCYRCGKPGHIQTFCRFSLPPSNIQPPQQNSRGYPAAPNYLRGYRSGGPSNRWYRVSNCATFETTVYAYHGSTHIESPIGPLPGCQCEDGACAMESGAAVIWKPDAEESCQFISVAAMKGTMADKVWLSDSKEFALPLSLSDPTISDCGRSLITTDQGYAIRIISMKSRPKRSFISSSLSSQVGLN